MMDYPNSWIGRYIGVGSRKAEAAEKRVLLDEDVKWLKKLEGIFTQLKPK